jgi:hypothetical protein
METRSRISHPGGLRRPSGMSALLVSTFGIGSDTDGLEVVPPVGDSSPSTG